MRTTYLTKVDLWHLFKGDNKLKISNTPKIYREEHSRQRIQTFANSGQKK